MILLTTQELADIYGVSKTTIHNWVSRRKLPHHKTLGGKLRFDPIEIRSFCERAGQVPPTRLVELTEFPWRS